MNRRSDEAMTRGFERDIDPSLGTLPSPRVSPITNPPEVGAFDSSSIAAVAATLPSWHSRGQMPSPSAAQPRGTATTTGLSVLVVDDEKNIRSTLTLCLEQIGCHVTAVGSGTA